MLKLVLDRLLVWLIGLGLLASSIMIIWNPSLSLASESLSEQAVETIPTVAATVLSTENGSEAETSPGIDSNQYLNTQVSREEILDLLLYVYDESLHLAKTQGVYIERRTANNVLHYAYKTEGYMQEGEAISWRTSNSLESISTSPKKLSSLLVFPFFNYRVLNNHFLNHTERLKDLNLNKGSVSFNYGFKKYVVYFDKGYLTNILIMTEDQILEDVVYKYDLDEYALSQFGSEKLD